MTLHIKGNGFGKLSGHEKDFDEYDVHEFTPTNLSQFTPVSVDEPKKLF